MSFSLKNYNQDKILYVFALESEAGVYFNNKNVVFTGIGKINATLNLMNAIDKLKPEIIINLGTAGSNYFSKHKIVNCTNFVQRDMDVSELGFEIYKTPLTNIPIILEYGIKIENLDEGICGTGDSFETNLNNKIYNVVDMEAYALALVCKNKKLPFLCLKYISDGANEEAAENWNENIGSAAEAFYNQLFI